MQLTLQRNEWKIKWMCPVTKTDSGRTSAVKVLMAFWSCQSQPRSVPAELSGKKWFQKLVITALITYSALSSPPPFLTLPPVSLFISASTWLQFRPRRLSLCHPPYGCSFLPLCEAMEIVLGFFFSFSFQLFLHLSIKPLSFLTVCCPAGTVALII